MHEAALSFGLGRRNLRDLQLDQWCVLLSAMPIAIAGVALYEGPRDACLESECCLAFEKAHLVCRQAVEPRHAFTAQDAGTADPFEGLAIREHDVKGELEGSCVLAAKSCSA